MERFFSKKGGAAVYRFSTMVLILAALFTFIAFDEANQAFAQGKPDQRRVTENPIYMTLDSTKWNPCDAVTKGITPQGCEYILLREDTKTGSREIFVRLPKSYVIPKHWHTNSEYLVGIRGTNLITIEGGKEFAISPGTYLYNPSGTIHWARCSGEEPCLFYIFSDKVGETFFVKEDATEMEKR